MSLNRPLLALVMISSVSLAAPAFATTPSNCVSDSDCAHGYSCQPSATITPPTPKKCAPDADCTTTDVGGTSGAGGGGGVSVTLSTCEPGPCSIDSDCGTDMVCHTETSSACSGGTAPACPANTKCDLPGDIAPPTCTTTTTSRCAFRWQLPCSADADCGSGFACQPSVYGSCSGGSGVSGGTGRPAGTGNVAGGAATAPSDGAGTNGSPPDTCTTTTAFPGWCQAVATTCATDTDCPSNWLCQVGSGRGAPVSSASSGAAGGDGATESGGSDPTTGSPTGVAIPTTKTCFAPYAAPIGAKDDGSGRTGPGETGGSADGTPGTGGTRPPGDSATGTGGTLGGSTEPTVVSASGTGGTTNVGHDSKNQGASNENAGCSVSPAAAYSGSGAAALVTLFGLGLVAVRRRRG